MVDIYDRESKVKRNLKNTLKLSSISNKNKQNINNFIEYLEGEGISYAKIDRYLTSIKIIAKTVGYKDLSKINKDQLENIKLQIRRSNLDNNDRKKTLSLYTKIEYLSGLKKFLKWKDREDLASLINTNIKKKDRDKLLPKAEDLLNKKNILKIINHCHNKRDKALISMLFSLGGARIGEALNVKIKDISYKLEEDYIVIMLEGKTGRRTVPQEFSKPYVIDWLNDHPRRNDKSSYLFITLEGNNKYSQMNYATARKVILTASKNAKITGKLVNPHAIRHSSASINCHKWSSADMNYFYGWVQGSNMASIYQNLNGEAMLQAYRDKRGLNSNKKDVKENKKCSRCNAINPLDALYCKECSFPLSSDEVKLESELSRIFRNKDFMKEFKRLLTKFK